MARVILILAVSVAALVTGDEECKKLGHPEILKCCKQTPPLPEEVAEHKECFSKMAPPPNCDTDICIAKKMGYAGAEDGKFDKKGVEAEIKKNYGKNPELADLMIANCVNGDLKIFGPPDFCDLIKMRHCVQLHMVSTCSDWDDAGECSGMQKLLEKCIEIK